MGKSNYKKSENIMANSEKKILTPQKRNEVNEMVKKLLKISSKIVLDSKADWENHIVTDKILKKLQEIEPAFNIDRKRESSFPNLMKWIKEHGGITEKVSIKNFGQMGYGLEATKDLDEGELICAVPRKIMMTLDNIENSSLKYLYNNNPILKNMGNIALALFLILEYLKGESSFWYPYISSLPTHYNTVLYFTLDDFAELKCSTTFEPAIKLCKNIARQYAYFNNIFQTSNDDASQILKNSFTYQLYRWAVSTVMTRQNFIPSENGGDSSVNSLIPLWDMCNHAKGYLSTQYKEGEGDCYACKPFKRNEQVLIYYGDRSNSDFFVHNGFTYEDNENDSFRFFLGVSKADKLYEEKKELLNSLGIPISGNFYIYSGCEPVRDQLLAYLRIFNMEMDDLNHWRSSNRLNDLLHKDCALSTKLEMKIWNFLFNRIKLLLIAYKDVNEVEGGSSVSDCRRLVRTQLRLEKRLLTNALEQVRQRIKS